MNRAQTFLERYLSSRLLTGPPAITFVMRMRLVVDIPCDPGCN